MQQNYSGEPRAMEQTAAAQPRDRKLFHGCFSKIFSSGAAGEKAVTVKTCLRSNAVMLFLALL